MRLTASRAFMLEVRHKAEGPQSSTLMLWKSHRTLPCLSPDFVRIGTVSYLQSVCLAVLKLVVVCESSD